jgi:hypothetical protein
LKLQRHAWQLVDGKQVYTQEQSSISSSHVKEYVLSSPLSIQKEMENLPFGRPSIQIVLFKNESALSLKGVYPMPMYMLLRHWHSQIDLLGRP